MRLLLLMIYASSLSIEKKGVVGSFQHTVINKGGSSYEALIDPRTNRVVKTWNHTRYERIVPTIPLPKAYRHQFKK